MDYHVSVCQSVSLSIYLVYLSPVRPSVYLWFSVNLSKLKFQTLVVSSLFNVTCYM